MPPMPHISQLPYVARLAFTLICITIIVYWMSVLQSVLTLLLISIILSIALFPLTHWFERKGFSRVVSIAISLVIFFAAIIGLGVILGYQISEFTKMLPQVTKKLNECIRDITIWAYKKYKIAPSTQIEKFQEFTSSSDSQGGGVVGSAVSTTSSMLGNLSILPVFMFFILYYRDMLKQFLFKVFNTTKRTKLNEIFNKIYEVVHSYMSGLLLVTLIVGTLNSVGLLLLGIKSAIFFGFLAAVLLIIPYFGIIIGSILPIVVALATKDSPMYALGVAGIFFLVQILEGNFITPYIVGSKISVNPLAALTALFLGQMLWGIAGMALALPLTAILKVVFDSVDFLKPYGYLIGEPDLKHERVLKAQRLKNIEREIVETIHETTDEVKSILKKRSFKKQSMSEREAA